MTETPWLAVWERADILKSEAEFHTTILDVVILGGGPAGSAAAIMLARARKSVLLLDQTCDDGSCNRAKQRTFAGARWGESLPSAANPLLDILGVTPERMAADHLRCCGIQSAWGGPVLRSTDSIRDPRGYGWHLERAAFDAMLRGMAAEHGAVVCAPARVLNIQNDSASVWNLTLDAAQQQNNATHSVTTHWIIDCTGRQSWFASRQGIRRIHDDRQIAFAGIFQPATCDEKLQHDRDTATLIESVPHGWWYTARVPKGRRVVVYLTNPDGEFVQQARTRTGFQTLLAETNHIQHRLTNGNFVLHSDPAAAAANSSHLEVSCGAGPHRSGNHSGSRIGSRYSGGWLAAGDSSLSFDPLSSQGLFHALYSGIAASKALQAAMSGNSSALPSYQARLNAVYDIYQTRRKAFYATEQRWPQAPFWRSRC